MGMLELYKWGLPNQGAHLNRYQDNEQLYNMARSFWASLDSAAIYFMLVFIIAGLSHACLYYYGYNKWPGRKYKIWHWVMWLLITSGVAFLATFILGNLIVSSNLQEKVGFLVRLSLINGIYGMFVYFIASLVICNLPVPTNAFRFLKFGK